MRYTGFALAAMLIAAPVTAQFSPEPDDSGLFFRTAGDGYTPATWLESSFDIEVSGIVARVAVTQRFRNEGRDWVEGVYVFPLPDDAAVDELTLVIGNRRIEGEIQEREQAKRTYEQARDAGQQASLVEQERPNLFTTSVANIAPGEEIVIEIGYLQTAAYDDGQFSLRLPLTLTPRFIPGGVPDAARIRPPLLPVATAARTGSHRASIEVVVDAGFPLAEIGSPSHELGTERDGDRYRLTTGGANVPMDRDLVVGWRAAADPTPRIAAFTETVDGDTYALLMFLPPVAAELPAPQPREILFVIDTSGSMNGESIRQARAALVSALARLAPQDRFNVIEFNNGAWPLFREPVDASPSTVQEATRFVAALDANGGTNIAAALNVAFAQPVSEGVLRQIVFMTDGSVGNEAALFTRIHDELGEARLFTIGIGTAPNTHFMRKAAEFGRGSYSHIARANEVEPAMQRLFEKLEQVALTDIALDWSVDVETYPARVPDLYRGEPVVVTARIDGRRASDLTVLAEGMVGPASWSQSIEVAPDRSPGVAALWARRKIESLLDRRLEGGRPDLIRQDVLAVALEHGLLSPYTSLVAVDRTPERTREAWLRREALGNLPPAGADYGRFTRLPATATGSRWYQLLGIVLAALVLGLYGIWRLTRGLRA